ncbi:hemerythrin [Comamonas sp. Y33R10-2]|uniref:hemerythrin domain-containing protein n=1 Tax=Comamonas sp. Y33R10-2 TaxID=2853257 RepID=UPI001C5C9B2F|nr:hemerythrin domain-containing protein [Comamonas sp. Y33R10-2]QXZ08893.1 hemerythrin [Comamonas sp. Y33R10-2]
MASLEWNASLIVDFPVMDEVHEEFVALLAQVEAAGDEQLRALWDVLIAHTQHHFDQEDRWMQATGFAPGNCHSQQHKVVLAVMREGAVKAEQGDLSTIRHMASELGPWFSHHAQNMDASLALHMRSAGFDPLTGAVLMPEALPQEPITGCGGACGTSDKTAEARL